MEDKDLNLTKANAYTKALAAEYAARCVAKEARRLQIVAMQGNDWRGYDAAVRHESDYSAVPLYLWKVVGLDVVTICELTFE